MSAIYADQDRNTTAVYVDGARVRQMPDNDIADELAMIKEFAETHRFSKRVIFGHGRVALILEPRR